MTQIDTKAWRKTYGLTQQEFANLLGVPRRTVEEWEATRGKGKPAPYLELALCELARRLKKRKK